MRRGGELSSKGTELTHISVIQCNRKKYVPVQSVGLTLWGKKKKSTVEWVTQQTKACMNLSLTPPLMSQVSGFQGEGLWSFPGKKKKIKLNKIDLISMSLRKRGEGGIISDSWETIRSIRSDGERLLQCSRAVSVSIPPHLASSPRVPLPEVTDSINTSGGSSRQAPFSYRDGSSG